MTHTIYATFLDRATGQRAEATVELKMAATCNVGDAGFSSALCQRLRSAVSAMGGTHGVELLHVCQPERQSQKSEGRTRRNDHEH